MKPRYDEKVWPFIISGFHGTNLGFFLCLKQSPTYLYRKTTMTGLQLSIKALQQ